MKFLFCPKCKELRVKPWFAIRDTCERCIGEATAIRIPRAPATYVLYALYILVPALIYLYVNTEYKNYLYASFAGLAVMIFLNVLEISRGEKYAKSKLKLTVSASDDLRRKIRK